ncbi:hypothetical protein ACNKHK_13420 [Shigella flexneri]
MYVREQTLTPTFLTAGSALVMPHLPLFARLIIGKASTFRITTHRIGRPLQAGVQEGQMVVKPKGLNVRIDTVIVIPPGKTLFIQGRISGNGRGRFILQDGCKVVGEQGGA